MGGSFPFCLLPSDTPSHRGWFGAPCLRCSILRPQDLQDQFLANLFSKPLGETTFFFQPFFFPAHKGTGFLPPASPAALPCPRPSPAPGFSPTPLPMAAFSYTAIFCPAFVLSACLGGCLPVPAPCQPRRVVFQRLPEVRRTCTHGGCHLEGLLGRVTASSGSPHHPSHRDGGCSREGTPIKMPHGDHAAPSPMPMEGGLWHGQGEPRLSPMPVPPMLTAPRSHQHPQLGNGGNEGCTHIVGMGGGG